MLKTFREHAQKNDSLKAEYRILRKDGGTSWIYLRAKRVGEWEGYPLFQGVFIDITQQKNIIRALEMEQQRYNVVTEITEEILFEQDIATDTLTFSSNFEKLFNRPRSIEHYLRDKHFLEIVHPDDLHLLPSTKSTELSEDDFMRFDARLLTSENTYQWFTICFKVLRDNAGKPTNVIGRLSNINDKKLEEDRLRREAQTDMLTGLYNKMTFKQLAEDMLSEGTHALIIVDIDDFKNVNDTYGHLFGDEVILTVASVVRDGFRSSDITGRIGGDEFAVFARDALDENVILKPLPPDHSPSCPRSTPPMATASRSVWASVSIPGTVKTTPPSSPTPTQPFIISKSTVVKAGMPYTANNGQNRKKPPRRGNIRFLAFFRLPCGEISLKIQHH